MSFKVVFIESVPVDNCRTGGFGLTLYSDAVSLQVASEDAVRLGKVLNSFTAAQVEVCAARVSDTDNYRNAASVRIPVKGNNVNDTDFPTTALHVTLYGTTLQPVAVWIKGIPDDMCKVAKLSADFIAGYRPWSNLVRELTNQNDGHWVVRRVPGSVERVPIVAFNGLQTTTPTVTLAGPINLVPGNKIRIQLVKGAPLLKRVWTVMSISADGLTVGFGPLASPLYAEDPPITKMGMVRDTSPDVYTTEAITKITGDYITKKNVGRPRGALTGARRAPK